MNGPPTREVWIPVKVSHKFVRGQMVRCNPYIKGYRIIKETVYHHER